MGAKSRWNLIKRGTEDTNYTPEVLYKNISFKDLSNLLKQLAQSHDIINEYYAQEIKDQVEPCKMQLVAVNKKGFEKVALLHKLQSQIDILNGAIDGDSGLGVIDIDTAKRVALNLAEILKIVGVNL